MGNPLFDRRTPQELAAGRQVIEITDKIDNFEQLSAVIEADLESLDAENRPNNWRQAPVEVQLDFGFADAQARQPGVTGKVSAEVAAVCQRCLQPMTLLIQQPVNLLFGESTAGSETGEVEVWELEESRFRPIDLVEELLVMAMPFAAMCDGEQCGAVVEDTDSEPAKDTTRPFADLKSQMESQSD